MYEVITSASHLSPEARETVWTPPCCPRARRAGCRPPPGPWRRPENRSPWRSDRRPCRRWRCRAGDNRRFLDPACLAACRPDASPRARACTEAPGRDPHAHARPPRPRSRCWPLESRRSSRAPPAVGLGLGLRGRVLVLPVTRAILSAEPCEDPVGMPGAHLICGGRTDGRATHGRGGWRPLTGRARVSRPCGQALRFPQSSPIGCRIDTCCIPAIRGRRCRETRTASGRDRNACTRIEKA